MSLNTVIQRLLLIAAISLTACGFHLRGVASLPFESILIQGNAPIISGQLREALAASGVKVVSGVEQAELQLELLGDSNEKRILSLGGTGLVQEYELFYRLNFRVREPSSELWGPVQVVERRRDFSYDDSQVLAKQLEEVQIYKDMRDDVVRELTRRLAAQKISRPKATP